MDEEVQSIHEHMKGLGLGALAHANWHANYYSMENQWWSELSVLQAAHAAEILIKAKIAEVHPLLIFERLPKASLEDGSLLSLEELIEGGRTFQFSELPDRLWATTGIKLPNIQRYNTFGRLRNSIQHFSAPKNIDISEEVLLFIYDVIDPLINNCWGLFAIDFNEDDESYRYLIDGLVRRGIKFLVSRDCLSELDVNELEWAEGSIQYKVEMLERFKVAGALSN